MSQWRNTAAISSGVSSVCSLTGVLHEGKTLKDVQSGSVLSYLKESLEGQLSPSTLKVYVATIAAHHDAVDGRLLGKHDLIIRFLRRTRRLNPPRPWFIPS